LTGHRRCLARNRSSFCKRLTVALAERAGAVGVAAAAAQSLDEIAHAEQFADVLVELAARIQRGGVFLHHCGRQGDVGGNHEIARLDGVHEVTIGDVEATGHLDDLTPGRWLQRFAGDEDEMERARSAAR
jgi:hypothetical protein